jgi:hypothetical protein
MVVDAENSVSPKAFQILTDGFSRRSTGRRDGWREELTPIVTCGRLRGAKCLSGFCAATGEMDERPSHRERRESVALRGAQQLVKRCVRTAPAKADQYAEGSIEDAAALHVERKLAGNPVSRHALLTSGIPMPVTDTARTIAIICAHLRWWPDPRSLRDVYVITFGREPCRRRPTSWPAGAYRITSSAIAGRTSTYPPAQRFAARPSSVPGSCRCPPYPW